MPSEREIARGEKQDLTLAPNEFGWVMDEGLGTLRTHTGPMSSSLSQSEAVVLYDLETRRFSSAPANRGKQLKVAVPEGWYCTLWNPARERPREKEKDPTPADVQWGRRVVIRGPDLFALWPGQVASVLQGHRLRQDEYVVVQVYDAEAAIQSLGDANARDSFPDFDGMTADEARSEALKIVTTGAIFVIAGTARSFFVPPTGFEVAEIGGQHVQKAVTLESLEYCLLVDRSGEKRYVQGPAVVFPEPTESFVTDGDKRKFRAFELSPRQGLHVKVIQEYGEEGELRRVGEELFLTGDEYPIYFPRAEHMFVKYGDRIVHSGVAVPAGEARYVMDRLRGKIVVTPGPQILLPDPRTEVVVRRRLTAEQCALLYPGNRDALIANDAAVEGTLEDAVVDAAVGGAAAFNAGLGMQKHGLSPGGADKLRSAGFAPNQTAETRRALTSNRFSGDSVDREGQYQAPRSIVLDGKYDGAVKVSVWEGFALLLVRQSGGRRVVQGPATTFLEYDEVPQVFRLSTGKPKNADRLHSDVYLRTRNNYVSDEVAAETADFQRVTLGLVYRVDFEGEPERWFSISNYVKHLTDSMRTLIREAVKSRGVRDFHRDSAKIVQGLLLPEGSETAPPGIAFPENGMRIKGIEVLKVAFDDAVRRLLEQQHFQALQRQVTLDDKRQHALVAAESNAIDRRIAADELGKALEFGKNQRDRIRDEEEIAKVAAEHAEADQARLANVEKMAILREADRLGAERANLMASHRVELEVLERRAAIDAERANAEAQAAKSVAEAFTPQIVSALQAHGDREQLVRIAQQFNVQGALSTLLGGNVKGLFDRLLDGTSLGERASSGLLGSGARAGDAE